ncbi:hypothetical protein SAMN04488124_3046 [Halogeometricum limi]|uniref:Uncharacterized protein n=1 Tax=Halogeometricum limi TaxID=555875 RepID=A0A1I6ICM6_9EURY|nr:hypothetical protein SAMN04488124_3046 [Halogeometricum limi]
MSAEAERAQRESVNGARRRTLRLLGVAGVPFALPVWAGTAGASTERPR